MEIRCESLINPAEGSCLDGTCNFSLLDLDTSVEALSYTPAVATERIMKHVLETGHSVHFVPAHKSYVYYGPGEVVTDEGGSTAPSSA